MLDSPTAFQTSILDHHDRAAEEHLPGQLAVRIKNLPVELREAVLVLWQNYVSLDLQFNTTPAKAANDFLAMLPVIPGYEDQLRQFAIDLVADVRAVFGVVDKPLSLRLINQAADDRISPVLPDSGAHLIVVPVSADNSIHATPRNNAEVRDVDFVAGTITDRFILVADTNYAGDNAEQAEDLQPPELSNEEIAIYERAIKMMNIRAINQALGDASQNMEAQTALIGISKAVQGFSTKLGGYTAKRQAPEDKKDPIASLNSVREATSIRGDAQALSAQIKSQIGNPALSTESRQMLRSGLQQLMAAPADQKNMQAKTTIVARTEVKSDRPAAATSSIQIAVKSAPATPVAATTTAGTPAQNSPTVQNTTVKGAAVAAAVAVAVAVATASAPAQQNTQIPSTVQNAGTQTPTGKTTTAISSLIATTATAPAAPTAIATGTSAAGQPAAPATTAAQGPAATVPTAAQTGTTQTGAKASAPTAPQTTTAGTTAPTATAPIATGTSASTAQPAVPATTTQGSVALQTTTVSAANLNAFAQAAAQASTPQTAQPQGAALHTTTISIGTGNTISQPGSVTPSQPNSTPHSVSAISTDASQVRQISSTPLAGGAPNPGLSSPNIITPQSVVAFTPLQSTGFTALSGNNGTGHTPQPFTAPINTPAVPTTQHSETATTSSQTAQYASSVVNTVAPAPVMPLPAPIAQDNSVATTYVPPAPPTPIVTMTPVTTPTYPVESQIIQSSSIPTTTSQSTVTQPSQPVAPTDPQPTIATAYPSPVIQEARHEQISNEQPVRHTTESYSRPVDAYESPKTVEAAHQTSPTETTVRQLDSKPAETIKEISTTETNIIQNNILPIIEQKSETPFVISTTGIVKQAEEAHKKLLEDFNDGKQKCCERDACGTASCPIHVMSMTLQGLTQG